MPELKTVDVSPLVLGFTLNNAVAATTLNIIRQGSAFWNRTGNRAVLRRLKVSCSITPIVVGATNMEDLRVLIVYDRQTNGTNFIYSDLIQQVNSAGVTAALAWDPYSNINKDRFLVLRDWKISSPQTVAGGACVMPFTGIQSEYTKHWDINLSGLETVYGADTGAVGDIRTGSLQIILQGNIGGQYNLSSHMRIFFQDP